jgi:hypothetical protein
MAEPSDARVLFAAATNVLSLVVAGGAAVGAAVLHSVPLAAVGGVAYVAMVAWDAVNPEFRRSLRPRPPGLPEPRTIGDDAVRDAVIAVVCARRELERVLGETPADVKAHLGVALASLAELEQQAGLLARRGDDLGRYLASTQMDGVRREREKAAQRQANARDAEARDQYARALAARDDQVATVQEITDAHERVLATLARVVAAYEAMPAKVVRMRALDAAAMDDASGSVSVELDQINGEVRAFEQALRSLAEVRA